MAFGLGVHLSWSIITFLLVIIVIILGSALFSTFSLIIACLVKTRERFMGIGQVLTNPLFFASNAIYPISIMPNWLQAVAQVNPLTYMVDALRALMLTNGPTVYGVPYDLLFLVVALTINIAIASKLYPKIII
jgi:ABC-2 type transport system permease protein